MNDPPDEVDPTLLIVRRKVDCNSGAWGCGSGYTDILRGLTISTTVITCVHTYVSDSRHGIGRRESGIVLFDITLEVASFRKNGDRLSGGGVRGKVIESCDLRNA